MTQNQTQVIVVGAGFTGLAAAYELAMRGVTVTVLEAEAEIGGLAGAFEVGDALLDRFYHHWFTNDKEVMALVHELGLDSWLMQSPTNTGLYYDGKVYKLSTPLDLLSFSALPFWDRIRLGLLTLRARAVQDWKPLEKLTAAQWLRQLGGETVFRIVWEPLLKNKFGSYAETISAVWFWNKLKLRGSSRGKSGEERLVYFNGSFMCLAEAMAAKIREHGGRIELNSPVCRVDHENGDSSFWTVETTTDIFTAERVILTPALPLVADMLTHWAPQDYIESLHRIKYIGNVCMVLELNTPLSQTYWLNVNNLDFPFVGVIEHTNFVGTEVYGGRNIVFLSKYLPHTDALYSMDSNTFLSYAFPFLKSIFPDLSQERVLAHHLWRARWSQPVVECGYSALIPSAEGPAEGLHLASMAQIYPEDRGTNYAVREGRKIGVHVATLLQKDHK